MHVESYFLSDHVFFVFPFNDDYEVVNCSLLDIENGDFTNISDQLNDIFEFFMDQKQSYYEAIATEFVKIAKGLKN